MPASLKDRVALITGSNRGTGLVIAEKLLDSGARVIIHSNIKLSEPPSICNSENATYVWGDITSDEGAEQVLKQIQSSFKEIHILVNNFGQALPGRWESLNTSDWLSAYQLNFLSTVRMCQHYIQQLKNSEYGRIINLSTIGAYRPGAQMPHYYAAKAALSNMTASLAKDLSGTGITVNCVAPGLIKTREVEAFYRSKAQRKGWGTEWQEIEAKIAETDFPNPMKRIARREEVADLVFFLASPGATFINAQTIKIDGGATDIC